MKTSVGYRTIRQTRHIQPRTLDNLLTLPMLGWVIVMILVYFPLIPNLKIGGFETSITGPFLLVIMGMILLQRQRTHLFVTWQRTLMTVLAMAFAIATIFSQNLSISFPFIPNLVIYVTCLFVTMAIIDSKERLVFAAKLILFLGFMRSIWGLELAPIREIFGFSALGVNASTFTFHPAFSLGLVIIITPITLFSRGWRMFAGLTFISVVSHGFLFGTRSAWLGWSLILLILLTRLPLRRWTRLLPIIFIAFSLVFFIYFDIFQNSWSQTQLTATGFAEGDLGIISNGDRVRRISQIVGMKMFYEHPILGWGPNMFTYMKPNLVPTDYYRQGDLGAFNAWLRALAETGVIGVLSSGVLVIFPLFQTWRNLIKEKNQEELNWLALGFALGGFGLAFHLLFIDQMFSFYWLHIGLALAAARLVLQPVLKTV